MKKWPMPAALAVSMALAACAAPADDAPEAEDDAPAQVSAAPEAPADGGRLLDPNAATMDQLMAIPGLDHSVVEVLMSGRPYEDMLRVDSVLSDRLSEEQRDSVYTRLWMPIDLNSAASEEILLIPGVGERMAHEFEEYRPYRGIEEFRREIGKYVDEAEVARLERYVTLR